MTGNFKIPDNLGLFITKLTQLKIHLFRQRLLTGCDRINDTLMLQRARLEFQETKDDICNRTCTEYADDRSETDRASKNETNHLYHRKEHDINCTDLYFRKSFSETYHKRVSRSAA